jgi:deoxyribodipyrimidine photo-lyase
VKHRETSASAWEKRNLEGFVSRLLWRDRFAQKLRNLPRCETESYLELFDQVPWSQNQEHYQAWIQGKTGYPLVDAAMRCLNQTGWLPFRLRALCATFLCIDLFLPWQWGAQHYMRVLMDADVAIDHWQWQNHAGVSNREKTWFRVYNPIDGIQKIDPDGIFIRQWLPEFADAPPWALTAPWQFGIDYPTPVVDHAQARKQALAILEPLKKTAKKVS